MIKILGLLIFNMLFSFHISKVDLQFIENNYDKAVDDKKLCAQMIEDLKSSTDDPVHLAYLGGLQTIWANHVINPLAKLRTFKEGRIKIEKAVVKDPLSVDVRYIRLSVQKNAPSFLGYNKNIKEDVQFLKKNRAKITTAVVLKNVDKLLKQ